RPAPKAVNPEGIGVSDASRGEFIPDQSIQTVFTLQNARMPCDESSLPNPDSPTPPKGSSGYDVVIPLTKPPPPSRPSIKRAWSAESRVQTFDPSSNAVAFAIAIASSASFTRNICATGLKSSSKYIRISGVTSVTTVGG